MSASAFNTFIQTEMPKRPYFDKDIDQETIIIRRGNGPRQLDALKLTEGQTIIFKDGQLKAVKAGGLSSGLDVHHHEQSNPSTEWVIPHNMNCSFFNIQCRSTEGKIFVPDEIEKIDDNTIHIKVSDNIAGTADIIAFN